MRLNRKPARIEAWDRRRAAVHEAGHIAVGAHFGVSMFGEIRKERDAEDIMMFNTWTGSVYHRTVDMPTEAAFEVGVAGVLAEMRYQDGAEDAYFDDPDACRVMLDGMSPTDRDVAGFDPWDDDLSNDTLDRVEAAFKLICTLWPDIWAGSRVLIKQHRERSRILRETMIEHSED